MPKKQNGEARAGGPGDVGEVAAEEPQASQNAFDSFSGAARALDHRDVQKMRGNAARAWDRARRGVRAVLERKATIGAELPRHPVSDLERVPDIALGLMFAELEVKRAKRAASQREETVDRARRLRKKMQRWADVLAEQGLVSEGTMGAVRGGDAPADVAEDCVTLARALAPHVDTARRLAGKGKKKRAPSAKKLAAAAELGSELARALQAGSGHRGGNDGVPSLDDAEEMRDRLWTLLQQRYQDVWRVGAYLYGPAVDERLPRLGRKRG